MPERVSWIVIWWIAFAVSLVRLGWFATSLDWSRSGRFGIEAPVPPEMASYATLLLPPLLLLIYVIARRLFAYRGRE